MKCVALFYWMSAMAFGTPLDLDRWQVVNDTVMGGVSSSEVVKDPDGTLEFRGLLSLENNGGFTSTRLQVNADWSGFDHLRVRVRGDGRTYLLTVRTQDPRMRRVYYRTPMRTRANEDTEWLIPIADFEAFAYGMPVRQAPHLINQLARVGSVGVMLADKKAAPFRIWLR